jgi:predicted HTH domain antitoxin
MKLDHIWNNLKEWEEIWEEQLENEKKLPEHEHKQHNIELLTKQLISIKKAVREIGKWV